MRPESGFQIAPNWPKIGKIRMTSQFHNMTSSPFFLNVVLSFWSSLATDTNYVSISVNRHLSFAQYLETEAS